MAVAWKLGVYELAADVNTYCIGPSVGYLTPYYIGSNWASEAATDTTLGIDNQVGGGSLGGGYQYGQLSDPVASAGNYRGDSVAVLSQGLNPNTLAWNKPDTWVKDGVNFGARQNFAYLSSEVDVRANYDFTGPAVGSTISPFFPARLSPDDIQFAPIRAGASGANMGGEDSFACTDGGSDTGADTILSGRTGNKAAENGSGGAIKNQLEGLAFWKIIAGQMAVAKPANVPKEIGRAHV